MNTNDKTRMPGSPSFGGVRGGLWKKNFEESKKHYTDWWNQKGIVLSMWEHLQKDGAPHEPVAQGV